jgi:hypothetical protein
MANSLKIKIGIAAFAIAVLILIPLLETKFFAPVTIKRWGKVSWDDFQGLRPPFSSYEAGISSSIYVEYDSTKARYVAYAGQNNIHSWAKRSEDEQDYLLKHEQNHFNITELHARMLNDYIEENPNGTLQLYLLRLGSINIDLSRMQRQYDEETNHSLVYNKQCTWDYRIDSLLILKNGWLTDNFSGARAYFTSLSDSSKGLIDGIPYRQYAQYTYGMQFSLASYKVSDISYRPVAESIKRNILKRSQRFKSWSLDTVNATFRVFAISEDSSSYTYYQLWVANDSYLYQLKTRYPNNIGDTTEYARIAFSFINSFRVVDTDSYWIEKLKSSNSPINFFKASQGDEKKDEGEEYCVAIGPSKQFGFYRGPFYRDDGAIVLAYDYLVHPDSLHFKDVLFLNEDWYAHTPTSKGQIYFLPAKNIPKKTFTIKFGYILLQDSVKDCYEFYHEGLQITPQINGRSNIEP